ncbi:hypothetical protein GO986_11575 [Deinococcus sp. HMF7620]|uniref:Uncharacterized protein n=2 Tax=Deinococcus arboris TaxID=2682977 RepID=A0A7C9HSB0_9DEIO|nr:hypothetical protein [Deinococcus arboris]MVN87407.1 hypothetical protein [Deinococcus arboris]
MMPYWAELVELFEYKVTDVLEGRVPRGGRRSLTELREELLGAPLEPALLRRVMESDRMFRGQQGGQVPLPHRGRPAPLPHAAWEAPATADSDETRAWEELHTLLWHHRAARTLQELAGHWQRDATLQRLRVLYTVVENAERAVGPGYKPVPVPAANDPLMDLHDPEVNQAIAGALSTLLLTEAGRSQVRTALSEVQAEPFPRHPDEDVLAARLAAAEREPMAPEARERLIVALKAEYPLPRDPRERSVIRVAAREVADQLEPLLDSAPSRTLGAVPHGSVLYAQHPASAMRVPDDGADRLIVHLRGAQAARWRGLELRWQPIGPNWQLQVDGQVTLLRPGLSPADRTQTVALPGTHLRLFVSGAYLMLHIDSQAAVELGRRASLARAVSLLLDSQEQFAYLRLARAAAGLLRGGPLQLDSLGPDSARKYHAATPDVLLAFARKGVDNLSARLGRTAPEQAAGAFQEAAAALGLHPRAAERLHGALHAALHRPEPLPEPRQGERFTLTDEGFLSVQLTDDPLTLEAGPRGVTLRYDYKGELVAVLPGLAPMILHDLLVVRVPDLHLLLVRHGTWLAATVGRDEPVPTLRLAELETGDITAH